MDYLFKIMKKIVKHRKGKCIENIIPRCRVVIVLLSEINHY